MQLRPNLERYYTMRKGYFVLFSLLLVTLGNFTKPVKAQTRPIDLAKEYYQQGEFEKALKYYDDIAKDLTRTNEIYEEYTKALAATQRNKDLENYLQKLSRKIDRNEIYRLDLVRFYQNQKEEKKAEKEFNDFLKDIMANPAKVDFSGSYLMEKAEYQLAEQLYLESRKKARNPLAHAQELSQLYVQMGDLDKLLGEQFEMLKRHYASVESIEQTLQNALTSQEQLTLLEKRLYEAIQKDPKMLEYNELLLWLYIQKKEFGKALTQAKAIDKGSGSGEPLKLMELGSIAFANRNYEAAVEIYEYITTNFQDSKAYSSAQRRLINAREEIVKSKYPIDTLEIKQLIADYEELIALTGHHSHSGENIRNIALLRAFYLNQIDSGIALLEKAIAYPRADRLVVAKSKLNLGDLYLLKGEPWESTLLYSQVEKEHKMSSIGYEAKLKNAQLSYFKGEFQLAQDHLDVLKLATSREIANDAMDLSILIQDNTGLDTSTDAMEAYAQVELELFKKNYGEALAMLDSIPVQFPFHSLTDEIHYLKSKIYMEINEFDAALRELSAIQEHFPNDLYGDDAFYFAGVLYEEQLGKEEKAMEMYKKILFDYSGSIYAVDARKRFRRLRGDAVVNP